MSARVSVCSWIGGGDDGEDGDVHGQRGVLGGLHGFCPNFGSRYPVSMVASLYLKRLEPNAGGFLSQRIQGLGRVRAHTHTQTKNPILCPEIGQFLTWWFILKC